MNCICRWFGHKRYPLDGDGNGVSIRNIDGCRRCGVILKARNARGPSHYVQEVQVQHPSSHTSQEGTATN